MDMHGSLPFSKAFDYASGAIGDRFQNPFWKVKELVLGAPLRKAVYEVKSFGRIIVAAAVQKRDDGMTAAKTASSKSIGSLHNKLINSLLDNIDDHQVVADAAMNYLSAGERTCHLLLSASSLIVCRERYDCAIIDMGFVQAYAPPASGVTDQG